VLSLLDQASRFIDNGEYEGPRAINPISGELEELAAGVAMVQAFSHVIALDSGDGLVLFDASLRPFGPAVVRALDGWSSAPRHTLVYTHGHVDHVGGAQALVDAGRAREHPPMRVLGHAAVSERFRRYQLTNGYNGAINKRQFGGGRRGRGLVGADGAFPSHFVEPTETYEQRRMLHVGELEIELRHDRGETDDHTWAWIAASRTVVTGDFVCWTYPNAGNPQKVQRYPEDWAAALRTMAALEPELLLPAHGLPIEGRERIRRVLTDFADALEIVVAQTLQMMNEGATLDTIIHAIELPDDLLAKPYLRPTYDEPEFVVHNVWRLYGGWYDGNPARLKPSPDAAVGVELAALVGGVDRLIERAQRLAAGGDLRLACSLIELATDAEPDNVAAHRIREEIYTQRRRDELSLMAKGIYGWAATESTSIVEAGSSDGEAG
jgi:glyoxylase-like metal-dependent hydrolase (beta-lactamase superfamily II)